MDFLNHNFGAIVQLVGIVAGLLAASSYVQSARLKACVHDAVAFAAQYEVQQIQAGNEKPAGAILKNMALSYIQKRFPNVNISLILDDIEAAVHLLNLQKYPLVDAAMSYFDSPAPATDTVPAATTPPPDPVPVTVMLQADGSYTLPDGSPLVAKTV